MKWSYESTLKQTRTGIAEEVKNYSPVPVSNSCCKWAEKSIPNECSCQDEGGNSSPGRPEGVAHCPPPMGGGDGVELQFSTIFMLGGGGNLTAPTFQCVEAPWNEPPHLPSLLYGSTQRHFQDQVPTCTGGGGATQARESDLMMWRHHHITWPHVPPAMLLGQILPMRMGGSPTTHGGQVSQREGQEALTGTVKQGQKGSKGDGNGGNDENWILSPPAAASPAPFFPWMCVSQIASTGPRRSTV